MSEPGVFELCNCNLVRWATGRTCFNLRELLEAIRTVPEAVIEHHMMRCALEDYFELYEFPNDLARWCWDALGDRALGEQLSLIDPYKHSSIDAVRAALVNVLEERLWGMDHVPWCRPGRELHLIESRLVIYRTGEVFTTSAQLADAIPRMPLHSVYFHVHEARRRNDGRTDDFSQWLEAYGADPSLVVGLRAIDFYFLNLGELRREISEVFGRQLATTAAAPQVNP